MKLTHVASSPSYRGRRKAHHQRTGAHAKFFEMKSYFSIQGCGRIVALASLLANSGFAEVASPELVPQSADSSVALAVQINCPTVGASIHYTTNGEPPTQFDPVVIAGQTISISQNSILSVKAWVGQEMSETVVADYRITGELSVGYQHALALSRSGKIWSWGNQTSGRLGNGLTGSAQILSPVEVLKGTDYFANAASVAAGFDHTVIVDQQGKVWAFGENGLGQLGNNATVDSGTAVQVLASTNSEDYLTGFLEADAGENFSVALAGNGKPYTWGSQSTGRLANGVNSTSSRKYAAPVRRGDDSSYPDLENIRKVAAGHSSGFARAANSLEVPGGSGKVWVWGHNHVGQLGLGNTSGTTRAFPMKLDANTDLTDAWDVSAGGSHTVVVRWNETDSDLLGTVWSCGKKDEGRLGNGSIASGSATYPVRAIKEDGNFLEGITQVSAGSAHTLALDGNGNVWAWGDNSYGQLGDGTTIDNGHARLVKDVEGTGVLRDIVMVSAGGEGNEGMSMALAEDGTIWVWGRNDVGQLGNGLTAATVTLPVAHQQNIIDEGDLFVWLSHALVEEAAPGEVQFVAIPDHGGPAGASLIDRVEVYLNGNLLSTLSGGDWDCAATNLAAGGYHAFALVYDINGNCAMSVPVEFEILPYASAPSPEDDEVDEVIDLYGSLAVGGSHFLLTRWNGEVWSWGNQGSGRLGNGSSKQVWKNDPLARTYPEGFAGIKKVAAGFDHSLALDSDGQVWAFGDNAKGQLGTASFTREVFPTLVVDGTNPPFNLLEDCTEIAAGKLMSLALDGQGKVRAWGSQASGRLGNGLATTGGVNTAAGKVKTDSNTDLSNVVGIAAGPEYGMARLASGHAYTWGLNTYGQLGIGNDDFQTFARLVTTSTGQPLADVIGISAGERHSVFICGSASGGGQVYCAGSEQYGKLGNNSEVVTQEQTYPVAVKKADLTDLTGIVSVSAGPWHTLALDASGKVWAWGYNLNGELGIGSIAHSKVAVPVLAPSGVGQLSGIVKIFAGGQKAGTPTANGYSFAIGETGELYAWGMNDAGQLALGSLGNQLHPARVTAISTVNRPPQIRLDLHQPVQSTDKFISELYSRPNLRLVASVNDLDGQADILKVDFFRKATAPSTTDELVASVLEYPWIHDLTGLLPGYYKDYYAVVVDQGGVTATSPLKSFDIPLHDYQAVGPPLPDWDRDGIADADDDGGILDRNYAAQNDWLRIESSSNNFPAHPNVSWADGRLELPSVSNATLKGFWDFESLAGGPYARNRVTNNANQDLTFLSGMVQAATPNSRAPLQVPGGSVRMDPTSPFMSESVIGNEENFAISFWSKLNANQIRGVDGIHHRVLVAGYGMSATSTGQGWAVILSRKNEEEVDWRIGSYVQTTVQQDPITSAAAGFTLLDIPDPVTAPNGKTEELYRKARTVDDGNWHHFTLVRLGANWSIYLDGMKLPGNPPGYESPSSTTDNRITFGHLYAGPYASNASKLLTLGGSLDRVRLYEVTNTDDLAAAQLAAAQLAEGLYLQDLDQDGIPDIRERSRYAWQDKNGNFKRDFGESTIDPFHYNAPNVDHDGDGLLSFYEVKIGTDPFRADTDGDGMDDGYEETYSRFDPLRMDGGNDWDDDGLSDMLESYYGTDPNDADSDDDGFKDGYEIDNGSDPTNSFSKPLSLDFTDPSPGGGVPFRFGYLDTIQPTDPPPGEPKNGISVTLADNSGSLSETWELLIGDRAVQGQKTTTPSPQPVTVDRMQNHVIQLNHKPSDPPADTPDYDYIAEIEADSSSFLIHDGPPGSEELSMKLLGNHNVEGDGPTYDTSWIDKRAYLVPIEKRPSLSASLNFSGNDAAGPRYRKVSLSGRPIADEAPAAEGETDEEKEETYIDAFDFSLHHNTSFVYVPVPASDLVLSVNAYATETAWTDRSGIRPDESLTQPFGIAWSSNLCSHIELISSQGAGKPDPTTVNVVDEQGSGHRFTLDAQGNFFPWPSARTDKKTFLNTLTLQGVNLVLKKKYGTTLVYEPSSAWFAYSNDRLKSTTSGRRHDYYRLKEVRDRFGNKLIYRYDGDFNEQPNSTLANFTLIPSSIIAKPLNIANEADAYQKIQISRSADGKRVLAITDPMGRTTTFGYLTSAAWSSRSSVESRASKLDIPAAVAQTPVQKLDLITFPDETTIAYGYEIAGSPAVVGELDVRPVTTIAEGTRWNFTDHIHANVKSITDKRLKMTIFNYALNGGVKVRSANASVDGLYFAVAGLDDLPGDVQEDVADMLAEMNGSSGTVVEDQIFTVRGLPRCITSVQLPDGSSSLFARYDQSAPDGKPSGMIFTIDAQGQPVAEGDLNSKVTDAAGNVTKFDFNGVAAEIVEISIDSEAGLQSASYNRSIDWMLYYTKLDVIFCGQGDDILGRESFEFDDQAGFALSKATDFSGNVTTWTYGDAESVLIPYRRRNLPAMMTKWPDPVGKTDALNRTEEYAYDQGLGLQTSVIDVHGVLREYTYHSINGRRESYKVTDPVHGEIAHEIYSYTNPGFPGFMTEKRILKSANIEGRTWESDLVTAYAPYEEEGVAKGWVGKETVDPGGLNLTTTHLFDKNGNRTDTIDSGLYLTKFHYDAMNRLHQVDHPPTHGIDGDPPSSEFTYYDANGNTAAKVDENGHATILVRDVRGRVVRSIRDMGASDLPAANGFNIISDADLNAVKASSDAANSQVLKPPSTEEPRPNLVTSRTYNPVGSLLTETDPRGVVTLTFYDALQRPTDVLSGCTGALPANPADALTWARDRRDVSHTRLSYDLTIPGHQGSANPGSALFMSSGFKPTKTEKLYHYREAPTSENGDDDTSLLSYAQYDRVYRPVYTAVQYSPAATGIAPRTIDDGWNLTSTTYGDPVQGVVDEKELLITTTILDETIAIDPGRITEVVSDGLGRARSTIVAKGSAYQQKTVTRYTRAGLEWQTLEYGLGMGGTQVRERQKKYDAAGRMILTIHPDPGGNSISDTNSPVESCTYDARGNVESTTDPRGFTTNFFYDGRNRLWKTLLPPAQDATNPNLMVNNVRAFSLKHYDGVGNVTLAIDERGSGTASFYDEANRPFQTRVNAITGTPSTDLGDPDEYDLITTNRFDQGGLIVAATDANGNTTRNAYDSLGRLTVTVTNPRDATTPDPYDTSFNSASYQSNPSSAIVVTNEYDDAGNLIEVKDGKGQPTAFTYDGASRKTRTIWDPDSAIVRTEQQVYDAFQLRLSRDPKLQLTLFKYDPLKRLQEVVCDPPAEGVESSTHVDNQLRSYDFAGNLLQVSYPNQPSSLRQVTNEYDRLDRLVAETSAGVRHEYGYDKSGNRVTVVYGGADRCLESAYDSRNRLTELQEKEDLEDEDPLRSTRYSYDRGSYVTRKTVGDNETTTFRDGLGRTKSIMEKSLPSESLIVAFDYTAPFGGWPNSYDGVGNVLRVSETYADPEIPNRVVENSYDRAYRLVGEGAISSFKQLPPDVSSSTETRSTTYRYDPASNRISKGLSLGGRTEFVGENSEPSVWESSGVGYYYDYGNGTNGWNSNQLMSVRNNGGQTVAFYSYDANGNRTHYYKGAIGSNLQQQYSYDRANRLVEVEDHKSGTKEFTYAYDHRSRRVVRDESLAGGALTKLSFSGGTSVQERVGTTLVAETIRGSDWGGGIGGVLYSIRGASVSINGYNSRGDVVSQTDDTGAVTWQGTYEAFGTRTVETDATANQDRQRANTKDEDPTGLLNEGMRYRDLDTGVFLTRDPAGFVDGPNVYTYVRQNPWTAFDPEGLWGLFDSNGPILDGIWNTVVQPAGDFVFEGMIGYAEVAVTGKDAGPSVSRAGNAGRNSGRVLATAAGAIEIVDGVKNMVVGGTAAGGGAVATVGSVGVGAPATVPVMGGGLLIAGVGALETLHGGYSVYNGVTLGLKDYSPSTSSSSSSSGGSSASSGGASGTSSPAGKSARDTSESNSPNIEKETGSYTNMHESGKTYDGKGTRKRSQDSAKRVEKETRDKHIATDWTSAPTPREGFKQESRRLDSHGGAKSGENYNKIESPGKKFRKSDGDD